MSSSGSFFSFTSCLNVCDFCKAVKKSQPCTRGQDAGCAHVYFVDNNIPSAISQSSNFASLTESMLCFAWFSQGNFVKHITRKRHNEQKTYPEFLMPLLFDFHLLW